MTFKVTGKIIIQLFHEDYSYKYLNLIIAAKRHHISAAFMQKLRENQ